MKKTMIIGVGGAGCNMADTFRREAQSSDLQNATYAYVDNWGDDDVVPIAENGYLHLNLSKIDEPEELITLDYFKNISKLYILAGLGGNTGTNWSWTIAELAKRCGIDYVAAVVTTPFSFEGEERMKFAMEGLNKFKSSNIDFVITLNNDLLADKYSNLTLFNAFDYADKAVLAAIEDTLGGRDL